MIPNLLVRKQNFREVNYLNLPKATQGVGAELVFKSNAPSPIHCCFGQMSLWGPQLSPGRQTRFQCNCSSLDSCPNPECPENDRIFKVPDVC